MFGRKKIRRKSGLTDRETSLLARFNDEHAHGIVHTQHWRDRMAELQQRYNDALDVEWKARQGK